MDAQIAADAPLDYITFEILQENRYNAFVYSNENEEMVERGVLNQLMEHLCNIKDQLANEPSDNFKLELPDNVDKRAWFTKAILMRFLHIVGSPDLKKCVAISNEMSQLEETRKFHLSLYAKAEDGIASSDNSKYELLRAMDSRIAALMEELVSTFNAAAGGTFSSQEMGDLQEFCRHFADVDFSNLLAKLSETSQKGQINAPSENKKSSIPFSSKNDYVNKTGGNGQILGSSNPVEAVKYNASPAKAAEIERQNSSESEDLSFSSEDEQPSVERSRSFVRSASPRRSASPVRRIQVGRSGPRRTPALTIKSLTCIPARERISSHREMGNDTKSEASEEPDKKTEINVTRISVQDAISLFESKQRDQTVDARNRRLFIDNSTNTNKSVLRRWSSGIGESRKSITESLGEQSASRDKSELVDEDALRGEEVKPDKNPAYRNPVSDTVEVDMESESSEKTGNLTVDNLPATEPELTTEKFDSAEWNRQKEEELSQMLMKFAESNETDPKIVECDSSNDCNSQLEQKSRAHGHYKARRDQKLKGENARKRLEKQAELRAKKKVQEKPTAENSSVKVDDGGKKQNIGRTQNVKRNEPVALNSKKESPKPAEPNKTKKSTSLPATRKSWPLTPSPRTTGISPAKVPAGAISSGAKPPSEKSQSPAPRQKPQSPGPLLRLSTRRETSQMQHKDVKKTHDSKKSSKKVEDGKSQVVPKSGKPAKRNTAMAPKVETKGGKTTQIRNVASEEDAHMSPAKAVARKRVTKKSSVVPLEAKPSPSMVSDTVRLEGDPSIQRAETPGQVEEILSKSEDPNSVEENAADTICDTVHLEEEDPVSEIDNDHVELGKEIDMGKPDIGGVKEISDEVPPEGDEIAERIPESPQAEIHPVQEPLISPAAWEETSHQDPSVPTISSSIPSPAHHDAVASPQPRVRHSLSQMLLEESSESDVIEFGNAENPPTMVYQKDAPKGFKRLLRFSRKNKGETNGAAWASPCTSDGDDDGDQYRALGKRNSDNLLRKVIVHSKNNEEGLLSDSESISARSNISKSSARSSNKFQEGHGTMKGARSFFSLSAFRGNKN